MYVKMFILDYYVNISKQPLLSGYMPFVSEISLFDT